MMRPVDRRAMLRVLLPAVLALTNAQPTVASTVQAPPDASPATSPDPGVWQRFGPPAIYYGLGFAGNGDVLVVGLDQAPAVGPVKLFIARYDAAGHLVSRVAMDRRYSAAPTGAIVVDASDDSVLIRGNPSGSGISPLRRVSSRTGKLVATIMLPIGFGQVAVDRTGRIFGVGRDRAFFRSPFIVRLRADGSMSASYDAWLRSPPRDPLRGRSILQDPVQVGFGRDGRLIILDRPYTTYYGTTDNGPPGDAPAITSLTTAIRDPRSWNVPIEFRSGTLEAATWALATTGLTADARGNVFLGEYIPKSVGLGPLGYRLRMFRKDGHVLATWGYKGNHEGLHWPYAPQVDASGRLWVLDIDPTAHTERIMVLAKLPGS